MARPRLRRAANEQARAEYQPQIRGVRREAGSQVRSIQSAGPALEASLRLSARQLRHAGLSPQDQAIALSELAHRTADVGASTALQTEQVQQEAHGQVVDLLQSEGQAASSALATMLHEAAAHRQSVQDEKNAEARGVANDLLKQEAEKHLGLGDYRGGRGGLTPTQAREAKESHHNAKFYAHQYFTASKHGVTDEKTGDVVIPAGPHHWGDKVWSALVEKVADKKGVNSTADAERAVQEIREHVQPGSGTPNTPTEKLASAAGSAAAKAPAAILQFALGNLLHRR